MPRQSWPFLARYEFNASEKFFSFASFLLAQPTSSKTPKSISQGRLFFMGFTPLVSVDVENGSGVANSFFLLVRGQRVGEHRGVYRRFAVLCRPFNNSSTVTFSPCATFIKVSRRGHRFPVST